MELSGRGGGGEGHLCHSPRPSEARSLIDPKLEQALQAPNVEGGGGGKGGRGFKGGNGYSEKPADKIRYDWKPWVAGRGGEWGRRGRSKGF